MDYKRTKTGLIKIIGINIAIYHRITSRSISTYKTKDILKYKELKEEFRKAINDGVIS